MSTPREGNGTESSRLEVPIQSAPSQLSSLSIEENYFAHPQILSPQQRPPSTDLPASLALPLSHTRSSTSPNTTPSSLLRAAPSTSIDDDNVSIRSFVPTVFTATGGDDLEAMLSEMLGSETRWRQNEDNNDDIDVWEGQSEDDSDSDLSDLDDDDDDDADVGNSICRGGG